MPKSDKAMDIYLRLLAERAGEALSSIQIAEYLIELLEHMDPEIARNLMIEDARRFLEEGP